MSSRRETLSAREAAVRLGVCDRTLRRYIAAGHISAYRLPGGHYRVGEDAIEEFWRAFQRRAPRRDRSGASSRASAPAAARTGTQRAAPLSARARAEYDLSDEHLAELRARYGARKVCRALEVQDE
jgi:excisionase family DNA binding protein